ncbi:MAG TPA: hypothetical protein PKA10_15665, partial [Selenomonadales bacterium]|nr:hypothetical protein [Selenomonadales bacterium]
TRSSGFSLPTLFSFQRTLCRCFFSATFDSLPASSASVKLSFLAYFAALACWSFHPVRRQATFIY